MLIKPTILARGTTNKVNPSRALRMEEFEADEDITENYVEPFCKLWGRHVETKKGEARNEKFSTSQNPTTWKQHCWFVVATKSSRLTRTQSKAEGELDEYEMLITKIKNVALTNRLKPSRGEHEMSGRAPNMSGWCIHFSIRWDKYVICTITTICPFKFRHNCLQYLFAREVLQ